MELFEYCSIRLKIVEGKAILVNSLKPTEKIMIEGATQKVALERINGVSTLVGLRLKETPLFYIEPYLQKLGQEGWEVIEYKSSEEDGFGEALLKRKIQKD